jgi:hypothetical protein
MNHYPELLEKLNQGRDEFLTATAGLTEVEASRRPHSAGWSILECAEHVATVEANLLQRLTAHTPLPDGPERNIEARILAAGIDRSRKFDAPEPARPTGRFATLQDAVAAFTAARARSIAWLEDFEIDLRRCSAIHPAFGPVTAYEMVLFMAMHPWRHALQIRDLRG